MPGAPLAATTLDVVVVGFVLLLAVRGAIKGFVWQAIRTVGLLLGLFLAARGGPAVGHWMAARFSFVPTAGSDLVGWAVVLVGTFLVVTLLAYLARDVVRGIRAVPLSTVDRVLGFALGGVLALGVAAFAFVLWAAFQSDEDLRERSKGSVSVAWMARFVETVSPLFPPSVQEKWSTALRHLDG
jgi:membrane protein required for colicin V production